MYYRYVQVVSLKLTGYMNGVVNLYARSGRDVRKRQFVGPVTSIRRIPNPTAEFFHYGCRYIKTGSPTFRKSK